jgi:hypothetical protein
MPLGTASRASIPLTTFSPLPLQHFYWAIVETGDALDGSFKGDLHNAELADGGLDFLGNADGVPNGGKFGIAQKIAHELVEQCVDRNGTFVEIADSTAKNKCNDEPSIIADGLSANICPAGIRVASQAINPSA